MEEPGKPSGDCTVAASASCSDSIGNALETSTVSASESHTSISSTAHLISSSQHSFFSPSEHQALSDLYADLEGTSAAKKRAKPEPKSKRGFAFYLLHALLYVVLTVAVVACAASGIFIRLLDEKGIPPLLSMTWRLQLMLLSFLPLFAATTRHVPPNYFQWKTLMRLVSIGVCFFGWVATWAFSLSYTTVTLSFVFTSCHVLFIVVYRKISRQFVTRGEAIGTVVGFFGLILSCIESLMDSNSADGSRVLIGNMVALGGSLFGVAYFEQLKFRASIPFFFFVIPVFFTTLVLFFCFSLGMEGTAPIQLGYWTQPDYVVLALLLGLVTGSLGLGLYQVVSKYLPPVVIAVSTLLQTIAATLLAWWLGIESVPSAFVWVGSLVIIGGSTVVIIYTPEQVPVEAKSVEKKEDSQEGEMCVSEVQMAADPTAKETVDHVDIEMHETSVIIPHADDSVVIESQDIHEPAACMDAQSLDVEVQQSDATRTDHEQHSHQGQEGQEEGHPRDDASNDENIVHTIKPIDN